MEDNKFDGLFMNVIQQANGIDGFFNAMFGFMRRKTDFFTDENMSKQKVNAIFAAHLEKYNEEKERAELIEKKKKDKEAADKAQKEAAKVEKATENLPESSGEVEEISEEEAARFEAEQNQDKAASPEVEAPKKKEDG